MYEKYWGLDRKPFENAPAPEFFYHAPEHAVAFDRVAEAIRRREGAALLTGDYGCGKTTMIRVLVEELELDQQPIAYLNYPRMSADEALTEILGQLGVNGQGDVVERLHELGDRLLRTSKEGGHTLVIVDEGQIIPDDRVLLELERLLDFRLDGASLLTFLLVGEPTLADRVLRMPHLDRKIALRQHLPALDRDQTRGYIAYRLDVAGAQRMTFTDEAVDHIYERTHGVPREINSVCDMSLFVGARKKATVVDEAIVRSVA